MLSMLALVVQARRMVAHPSLAPLMPSLKVAVQVALFLKLLVLMVIQVVLVVVVAMVRQLKQVLVVLELPVRVTMEETPLATVDLVNGAVVAVVVPALQAQTHQSEQLETAEPA
jgi:hypothetical protein